MSVARGARIDASELTMYKMGCLVLQNCITLYFLLLCLPRSLLYSKICIEQERGRQQSMPFSHFVICKCQVSFSFSFFLLLFVMRVAIPFPAQLLRPRRWSKEHVLPDLVCVTTRRCFVLKLIRIRSECFMVDRRCIIMVRHGVSTSLCNIRCSRE